MQVRYVMGLRQALEVLIAGSDAVVMYANMAATTLAVAADFYQKPLVT